MPRTTLTGRPLVQPYTMHFVAASSQRVGVGSSAANRLDGLSACTMVIRMFVNAVINNGAYFSSPTDGTSIMLIIRNSNNGTSQNFRYAIRVGGVTTTNNIAGFKYNLGQVYTIALRYTGSALEFWVDGVLLRSDAISGTFGTTSAGLGWNIGQGNGGASSSMDVLNAIMWTSSLSDANLALAMANNYVTGAALQLDFTEGSGTPVEKANGATVTLTNTPTWVSLWSRTNSGTRTQAGTRTSVS